MGTQKPLARSSAISNKEGTKDEEAIKMYTLQMKDAKKRKTGNVCQKVENSKHELYIEKNESSLSFQCVTLML